MKILLVFAIFVFLLSSDDLADALSSSVVMRASDTRTCFDIRVDHPAIEVDIYYNVYISLHKLIHLFVQF